MNKGVAFYLGSWVGLFQGLAICKLQDMPIMASLLGVLSIVGSVLFYLWDKKAKKKENK